MTNKQALEFELADFQCLEACADKGFTIQDWLELKESMISNYKRKLLGEKLENGDSVAKFIWYNVVPHQSASDLGCVFGSPQSSKIMEYYKLVDGDRGLIESVMKECR